MSTTYTAGSMSAHDSRLTEYEGRVLAHLQAHGPCTVDEVRAAIGGSPFTVRAALERMVCKVALAVPDQLPTVAQVAHVVATVLGRHGVICPPIGQHDDAGTSAVCCVFYEGTDAARFFSLDHCYGYGANVYDDYEEMRAALTEIGAYHEQAWAKACVYPI